MNANKPVNRIVAAWNGLAGIWRNVKLLQRLIIGSLLFLIIPVLVIGIAMFSVVLPLAQREARESLVGVVNQLSENVRYRIAGYQNILAQLSIDPRLSVLLTQDYTDISDAVDSLQQISSLMQRISSYFPMRRVYIYKDNPTLPEDGGNVLNLERAYPMQWYKDMMSAPSVQFHWFYDMSDTQMPSLNVSTALNEYWSNDSFGVIRLEIPCQIVFDQLSNPLEEKKGWVMLLDKNRRVLANYLDKKAGELPDEDAYLDEVYKNSDGWIFTKVNGKQCLVVYDSNDLGWKIIAVVSQEALWKEIQQIRNVALITSVFFVLLTVIVLIGFGSRITHRLTHLVASMREVRKGNLGLQVKVYGSDELAETENEFNAMSNQLESLLKELVHSRALAEEEKIQLLQAQINPHFLYNTLALVKYMAMDSGADDICGIIDTIARFFRLSLNHGKDLLLIREEIDHVRAYLEIHEQRYPRRVSVTYQISDDVLDCEIVKMTLQPIVENALIHAFVKTAGYGEIRIEAFRKGDNLFLRVIDNGCGMSSEAIDGLLSEPLRTKERAGFGVHNVHERLKRRYGEPFGLKIVSVPNLGTTVEVGLPYHPKDVDEAETG